MKKILSLLLTLSVAIISFASGNSLILPKKTINANEVYFTIGKNAQKISLMDLSRMKVKEFEKITGQKLKFINKIGFALAQKQLRSSISSDGTINSTKLEKFTEKAKGGSEGNHHYLRMTLIFLAIAIAFGILTLFVPILWIFSTISGLIAAIFFILWLISMS